MKTALHMLDAGEGSPVVLLHGTAAPASYFEPLVKRLARSCRVLVPDMPGYGRSAPCSAGASLEETHASLEAALLERGVARAVLVGSSLGGYRALALALRKRIDVTGLVLLGAFASLDPAHRNALAAMADTVAPLADLRAPSLRQQIASLMFSPEYARTHPEAFARAESWLDSTRPGPLADEVRATSRCEDLRPGLPTLSIPVLCRVGELDAATPLAYSQAIVEGVSGARLEVVPRAGHALLIEDEAATLEAIGRSL